MGGRGASSTSRRLPNSKNAFIPKGKTGNYFLNPDNENNQGKTKLFNSIGYNMKNKHRLEEDILRGIKNNTAKLQKEYEDKKIYEVNMQLGINKKIDFITIWQVNKKETKLITAKPKERKK